MIRVAIAADRLGLVRSVDVAGHAGVRLRGSDIVCSAVTTLVRSAARLLDDDERVTLDGSADDLGSLSFEIHGSEASAVEYIRGVGDFLIKGISDIASEFPERCSFRIEETADGT